MLIKSIDARDFRKYSELVVNDIPESGVITIAGSNESGKTSIGEAICFALVQDRPALPQIHLSYAKEWSGLAA